jgi:polyhydroxybutyrate depolymerase
MKSIALLILFLVSSFSLRSQVKSDSVLIEGHYRTFHFIPPQQTGQSPSLVFILHGSGGTGKGMMRGAAKLEASAKSENLLLVYPDGYKNFWNECRKAANSAANTENINENAFFDAMIKSFRQKYGINERRVFAIGTSGGGHMAYKLALTMPNQFKAITAIVANLPDTNNLDCPEGKIPVAVMIVNGTKDSTNPYQGGLVVLGNNYNMGRVRSTDRTFHYWATLAGYQGKPVREDLPDRDPADGKTIERYRYQKKGKPEVVLLKVIGGQHDYPNDIDVYIEAWAFFKRQISQ